LSTSAENLSRQHYELTVMGQDKGRKPLFTYEHCG